MSETKHSIWFRHEFGTYPDSPKTLQICIFAKRGQFVSASKPRYVFDMPAEILGMDESETLAHEWTAELIREADAALDAKIKAALEEMA